MTDKPMSTKSAPQSSAQELGAPVRGASAPGIRSLNLSLSDLRDSRSLRTATVLLLLWLGLAAHPETREAFLSASNLSNVTAQVAEIVIMGVGMTFVILIGGIDLSVGAGMALFGVIAAQLQIDHQQPAGVAIAAALLVSLVVGAWHGLLVARFKVPPFVATLSGFLAYRGLALVLSDARGLSPGTSVAVCVAGLIAGILLIVQQERRRRKFALPAQSPIALGAVILAMSLMVAVLIAIYREGMPVPVLIAAAVTALGAVLLRRSRLGRYAFAIGGNVEAARLSGVPVGRVTLFIYLIMAVLTALAGLVATARTNGVTPGNMGLIRELHVITAVVIGGTSLSGGRGSVLSTVLGVFILGVISNGLNILGVRAYYQYVVKGLLLIAAVGGDSYIRKRQRY